MAAADFPPVAPLTLDLVSAIAYAQNLPDNDDAENRIVAKFAEIHRNFLPLQAQLLQEGFPEEIGKRAFASLVPFAPSTTLVQKTADKVAGLFGTTFPLGDITCTLRNGWKILFGCQGPVVQDLGGGAGLFNAGLGIYLAISALKQANDARKIQDTSWMTAQLVNALAGLTNAAAGYCWLSLLFVDAAAPAFAALDVAINPLFLGSTVLSAAVVAYKLKNLYPFRREILKIMEMTKATGQVSTEEQKKGLEDKQKADFDQFLVDNLLVTQKELQEITGKNRQVNEKTGTLNLEALNKEIESLLKRKFFKFQRMTNSTIAREALSYVLKTLTPPDVNVVSDDVKIRTQNHASYKLSPEEEKVEALNLLAKVELANHRAIAAEHIKLILCVLSIFASALFIAFPAGLVVIYVIFALCGIGWLYFDLSFFSDKFQFHFLEDQMIALENKLLAAKNWLEEHVVKKKPLQQQMPTEIELTAVHPRVQPSAS